MECSCLKVTLKYTLATDTNREVRLMHFHCGCSGGGQEEDQIYMLGTNLHFHSNCHWDLRGFWPTDTTVFKGSWQSTQTGYWWRKLLYLPYSETVCVSAKRKCSIGTGNNWTLTLIIYKILIYTSTGQTYLRIYFFLFLGGGGGGCSHWTLLVPRPFLPPLFDHLQFAKTERWVIDQIMEAVKAREHDCDELSFSQPPPLE